MHTYLSSHLGTRTSPTATDEDRLRLAELETVLANISDGLLIADGEGHLLAVNEAARRLYRCDTLQEARALFTNLPSHVELRGDDGAALPPEAWPLARVLRGEAFDGLEVEVRPHDADYTWTGSYNGSPLFDDDGHVIRAVLTVRDITRRKHTEQALRTANATLRRRVAELDAVIASIPDAVYIGNASGIEWANQDALDQLGYEDVSELNRHVAELGEQIQTRYLDTGERIAPEDEGFARALRGLHTVREVVIRHLQNAEDRIVRSAAAPIQVDGEVIGAVAVNTDITEKVRAEEALRTAKEEAEQALQSRDRVLAVVSHDLYGLVGAVKLGASILREASGPNSPPAQLVENAAAQMNHLIDDLLIATRLEADQPLPIDVRPTDLAELLREVQSTYTLIMQDKDLQFHVHLPDALPVLADPKRITQVVSNLIGNALKFTPAGGEVTVRAEQNGREVRVEVADTGPGIDPAHQERIFEAYWQADDTGHQGSGLGLAIARGIVEHHGGTLQVASELGEGTTFTFTLPTPDATDAASQEAAG